MSESDQKFTDKWREIPGRPGYYERIGPISLTSIDKRPDKMIQAAMAQRDEK